MFNYAFYAFFSMKICFLCFYVLEMKICFSAFLCFYILEMKICFSAFYVFMFWNWKFAFLLFMLLCFGIKLVSLTEFDVRESEIVSNNLVVSDNVNNMSYIRLRTNHFMSTYVWRHLYIINVITLYSLSTINVLLFILRYLRKNSRCY